MSQQLPGGARRHGVEAQMHAVGFEGQRDVEAAVDEDFDLPVCAFCALARSLGKCRSPVEQVPALESPFPDLQPVDPTGAGPSNGIGQRVSARVAVDNEAQDCGVGGQNVARPSSGLEAEA